MEHQAYTLHLPYTWTSAVVFSSPHSGRAYSKAFLKDSQLDSLTIRSSEDAYVDDLLSAVPSLGAPVLAAKAPRAYLDLNRNANELDPAIIEGAANPRHNPRVASGLGVIPRVVSEGRAIRAGKLSMIEAQTRLNRYYHPYHQQLLHLVRQTKDAFGQALLLDVHSMPSEALSNITVRGGMRPDVVLGDRFGASCSAECLEQVERAFASEGFTTVRNMPFAGAYILRRYGRPAQAQNALQIELDRGLYLNEKTVEKSDRFADTHERLNRVFARLVTLRTDSLPIAAE